VNCHTVNYIPHKTAEYYNLSFNNWNRKMFGKLSKILILKWIENLDNQFELT
jgi:hypothetical protein